MLHVFNIIEGTLREQRTGAEHSATPIADAIWVDVTDPTPEERVLIEAVHKAPLPDPDEMEEIESPTSWFVAGQVLALIGLAWLARISCHAAGARTGAPPLP